MGALPMPSVPPWSAAAVRFSHKEHMGFEPLFRGCFPPPPRPRTPESFLNLSRWVLFAIVAFFLLSLANVTKSFLVDLLWFQSLGYGAVFTTRLVAELWLFVLGTLIIVAIYFPNLWLPPRHARRGGLPPLPLFRCVAP